MAALLVSYSRSLLSFQFAAILLLVFVTECVVVVLGYIYRAKVVMVSSSYQPIWIQTFLRVSFAMPETVTVVTVVTASRVCFRWKTR